MYINRDKIGHYYFTLKLNYTVFIVILQLPQIPKP